MSGENEEAKPFLDVPLGDMESKETFATEPPSIMRRFALFVDGMARALILPFGPDLVHRLVYKTSELEASSWSGVSYYLGWMVSAYIVGRWLGSTFTIAWNVSHDRLPKLVARLGGIAVSLHVFTYGAGLGSVKILVAIRFLSAILAGVLCGITNEISLPEDEWSFRSGGKASLEEERVNALRRREGYVEIASGTAKIYLTGFAVSILSGGLLFRQASKDSTFQALTGAYQYSWSPLFLIGLTVAVEVVLRGVFACNAEPANADNRRVKIDFQGNLQKMATDKTLRPLMEEGCNEEMSQVSHPMSMISEKQSYFDVDAMTQGGRSRRESYTSIDDFYDCHSVLSDADEAGFDDSLHSTNNGAATSAICSYVGKRCVYPDGSPAFVPPGECIAVVPEHYLKFYNNNEARARKAWEKTQEWRREKNIWRIHDLSNRWFFKIKEAYPHFVHGHTKQGFPVVYEKPGKMRIKEMFREGIETADMVKHLIFFLEYLSIRLSTSDEVLSAVGKTEKPTASTWGMMVVMDLEGLGVSHISGDVLSYLKQASAVNSEHYPMAMKRAFLINSPFWLAGAWSGLKGILPDSVQVDILSAHNYLPAISDYIDPDQIPPEYGGTSPYTLGSHPYEKAMQVLVEESMNNHDTDPVPNKVVSLATKSPPPKNVSVLEQPSATKWTPSPLLPKRRWVNSQDRNDELNSFNGSDAAKSSPASSGCYKVFLLVSSIHFLWSTVQGAIELAIPLWILSPARMGGLGYSPSRSGVSLFTACLVLLAVLRSRSSRMVSKIPSKSPLRALRIGAGSESVLLVLLSFVTCFISPAERGDSVTAMTCSVIVIACMALATMLGRSASKILHRIAAESYVTKNGRGNKKQSTLMQKFLTDCECGRFTASLNLSGEIIGVFLLTPLWTSSIVEDRQPPFNAVFPLLCCGAVAFVLYAATFSLYLDAAGEFAPNPKHCCSESKWRWCLRSVFEAIAVSSSDIASLFEESNWSATPLLGRSRSRTFSESSAVSFLEMMERGEEPSPTGRKIR